MSFKDGLASFLGRMAVKNQEMMDYKREYEGKGYNYNKLKEEYERLCRQSGSESSLRKMAIKSILDDRKGR